MRSIYYGPSLARELYVYVGFVTGLLRSIQEELEAKLVVETHTSNGILQALALSNIYSNDFEKAFARHTDSLMIWGKEIYKRGFWRLLQLWELIATRMP